MLGDDYLAAQEWLLSIHSVTANPRFVQLPWCFGHKVSRSRAVALVKGIIR